MTFLTCQAISYGASGWDMPQSYTHGTYMDGIATIKCTIDCADPLIYDPITFALTIPNELKQFGGRFELTNANGIDIQKIFSMLPTAPYTFFNDNGATKFTTTAVGVAVAGNLIYTTPAPAIFTLQYRVSGLDFIVLNTSGSFNAIVETAIFV